MSHVDLGFAQACEPWQLTSAQFPSKIGGKPAWLHLENLPTPENLQCDSCRQPLIFLCQIYAPYEESDENFHRTVFIFICRDPKCCVRNSSNNIKVFRSSLARYNKFYSAQPPKDGKSDDPLTKWLTLCEICGCFGTKKCSKCKSATYCSREHQVIDWKEGHKNDCACETQNVKRMSLKLFPQLEMVMEAEESHCKVVDETEQLEKFNQLKLQGELGTMSDVSDSDIEKYAVCDTDKVFAKFKERIADNDSGDQVLRYERGGQPLWIASEPRPQTIPDCEYCAGPRQFEFQVMPQLLAILHENDLDIGVLAIYTCSKSCTEGQNYKKEYVFKQDVALTV